MLMQFEVSKVLTTGFPENHYIIVDAINLIIRYVNNVEYIYFSRAQGVVSS